MSDEKVPPILPCRELEPDALPFVLMASEVGLSLLQHHSRDRHLHRALEQIFEDIKSALTGVKPLQVTCSHCKTQYRNDPSGYGKCLLNCPPG